MKRGEIWWADLPSPSGTGPRFRRPVLVVQSDAFNDSHIPSVVVVTLKSDLALSAAPGNVALTKAVSGLKRTSVVNVSQVLTLDRSLLAQRIKAIPNEVMSKVTEGLQLAMGL